jgi:hypothetical protein
MQVLYHFSHTSTSVCCGDFGGQKSGHLFYAKDGLNLDLPTLNFLQ